MAVEPSPREEHEGVLVVRPANQVLHAGEFHPAHGALAAAGDGPGAVRRGADERVGAGAAEERDRDGPGRGGVHREAVVAVGAGDNHPRRLAHGPLGHDDARLAVDDLKGLGLGVQAQGQLGAQRRHAQGEERRIGGEEEPRLEGLEEQPAAPRRTLGPSRAPGRRLAGVLREEELGERHRAGAPGGTGRRRRLTGERTSAPIGELRSHHQPTAILLWYG